MNPIFQQMLIRASGGQYDPKGKKPGRYARAILYKKLRRRIRRELISLLLLGLGITSAAFGLESFLLPNKFIDGGVTGISLLVTELSSWPLPLLLVVLNIPFVWMGYRQVGLTFAIKTAIGITGLALCVTFVHFPALTGDKLLAVVFGGFFVGAGIGLAMRGGGVLDGTEVMAVSVSRKTGLTIGDIILVFNIVIFGVAAWLLSLETALYSVLAYLSASKTVDYIISGVEEYTGVTIISSRSEKIRLMITESMGRGVTVYSGKRGYGKKGERRGEIDILYSVITRLEISRLNTEIEKIDPDAFVIMSSIRDTRGGMIKKRALGH